jgi:hypothetical protein
MAGSTQKVRKEKKEKTRKSKKEDKYLADQLEEKYVGTRTEVFSRISAKEAEIRTKTNEERAKADRLIEDAKGQAAAAKRKATLEELGKDVHAKIIADAQMEVGNIENNTAKEITNIEKTGEKNLDRAVEFIVDAVISTGHAET